MKTVLSIDIPDFNGGYKDFSEKDNKGRTLFSYAAERGSATMDLLLECTDLDINLQDNNGWTPLSYAVENVHVQMIEAILKRKDVDMNLGNMDRFMPLDYTGYTKQLEELSYTDHGRIADMLRMYGCADSLEVDYSTKRHETFLSFPGLQFKPEPETAQAKHALVT